MANHTIHVIRYSQLDGNRTLIAYHTTREWPVFMVTEKGGANAHENLNEKISAFWPKGGQFSFKYYDVANLEQLTELQIINPWPLHKSWLKR